MQKRSFSGFVHSRFLVFVSFLLATTSFVATGTNVRAIEPPVDPDHAAKRTKGLVVFKSKVRDVLKQKCLHCHGGDSTEGKLDIATQKGLLDGGERGPAAVIGRGEKSLLTRVVAHQQEPHMPKDADKLAPDQIAAIVEWIDLGAPYAEPLIPAKIENTKWTERKIAADAKRHWAYQPLNRVTPPKAVSSWVASSIDGFIDSRLDSEKLHPNERVGKAELIRRVFFDLIGLPPTAVDVEEFLTEERPDSYERLIDQLLANPHYGERWGRRWLDLARFAESHGFEHDYDRATAFHYRDFVVQALNAGMPYDQFVRWQIAGDELAPNDRLAMMATGFLAAGVHSTQITKNEVEKHRYDEMDDMLSTIGTSMLGLTIGCARCHDHKFDAIPQADYYRLLSSFTTTIRSEVDLDFDPEGYQRVRAAFDREHLPFDEAVRTYETEQLPQRFAEWRAARDRTQDSAWLIPEGITYKSQGNATFARQPDESWLVGGTNPANDVWTITFETHLKGIKSLRLETLADASLSQSGPGRAGNGNFALSDIQATVQPLGPSNEVNPSAVKFIKAKATFEQNGLPVSATIDDNPASGWAVDPEFGKNHAAVFSFAEDMGFQQGTRFVLTLRFNTNVNHSIGRPRVTISQRDDLPATNGGFSNEEILALIDKPIQELTSEQTQKVLDWFKTQDAGWKSVDDRRAAHAALAPKPRVQKVLVASEGLPPVTLHTQAEAEFLKETHFLRRGETNNKDAVATQSYLQVLMANPETPQLFQSQPPTGWRTSYQRTSLTNWLVDREAGAGNLLARVVVNRWWQFHLGRGIVGTSSDFGLRGELPSHPELLDWLASELIRHQWELKPLHRQILTSSVYQQSCDVDESRSVIDRENRLLWHRPRRRLEAEVIRDAILATGDLLNDQMYGPGRLDEGHRRRSLYFTVKRSQLIPSMTVFDAPDGTTPVADRPQTTIAPQALLLMNSPHVREASRQFANRLIPVARKSIPDAIRFGYLSALSRRPTDDELINARNFIDQQQLTYSLPSDRSDAGLERALVDFCQVLFCLNEFIYAE